MSSSSPRGGARNTSSADGFEAAAAINSSTGREAEVRRPLLEDERAGYSRGASVTAEGVSGTDGDRGDRDGVHGEPGNYSRFDTRTAAPVSYIPVALLLVLYL